MRFCDSRCILTPNAAEFERLVTSAVTLLQSIISTTSKSRAAEVSVNSRTSVVSPDTTGTTSSLPLSAMTTEQVEFLLLELQQSESVERRLHALAVVLDGVTVLRKGPSDMICSATVSSFQMPNRAAAETQYTGNVYVLAESENTGSKKRCGGQGDILAGSIGVSFFWGIKVHPCDIPHNV